MGVEDHHPIPPAVADEDALVGGVVGEREGNLERAGAHRPQLGGVQVRLAEHPARLTVENPILRIELPADHPVVVLIDREEPVVDRIQSHIPRIDIARVDPVVRGPPTEVGVHLVVQVADHLDGRRPRAEVLGRDIPDQGAIPPRITLGRHEQLTLGIDGAGSQPRPDGLIP